MIINDNEERIKRFYENSKINRKINKLVEYYKFHNEVPRIFI